MRTFASPTVAPDAGALGGPWDRLTHEIEQCVRCPLHRNRTHAVVYRGGDHPRVVFVGEAPGRDEDRLGKPFVGRAGRVLDRAIERVGLVAADVGIINLIKCRPPDNRFDPAAETACHPYLDRQLDLLRPERLVTLGRHALHALVPEAPAITLAAGHVQSGPRGAVFPLLHPSAPMHAPRLAARWEQDVELLRAWLASPPDRRP
ncbi:MAG: uracil-DNA glycosylase [Thermoplasmata archaeon]|nr:uracil-DNA glycosylase [Thermoplasmata archaeon]MCI4354149.1 uracil-DNA glycosylase [Thermoplasmata archaeon]